MPESSKLPAKQPAPKAAAPQRHPADNAAANSLPPAARLMLQLQRRIGNQAAQRLVIQRGALAVKNLPAVSEPVADAKVFGSAPDYIEASMDGEDFKIKAGQTFLNDETSAAYKADKGQIRGANATLMKPMDAEKLGFGPDVRVIGDGHHRFVWSSFHGEAVNAVKKMGFLPAHDWSALTYRGRPGSLKAPAK